MSSLARLSVATCLALALSGCQRSAPASDRPAPLASTATPSSTPTSTSTSLRPTPPSGSPLARLVPAPHAGPRAACPLAIVPGVSLGPIALGETLADLERGGLVLTNVSDTHADVSSPGKTDPGAVLKVTLCAGKIIDIWIDDLRLTTACVSFENKPIAPATSREDVETILGGCTPTAPRIGGAFERCQDGGVYVGHGMGTFLQLRVKPREFPFDADCAFATDDGSLVELSETERRSLFQQTLNLSEISKYWHPDKPGRDPLRIVKTPLVAPEPLKMFASPVVWIDEAEAKKGTAFFTITKLEASKTKATVSFAYPVEGVVGTAVFKHGGPKDPWRLDKATVAER